MAIRKHRLNAFQVFDILHRRIVARQPTAAIRLGDGEGALLGYPRITNRADVDRSLRIWLGTTAIADADLHMLAGALRDAVRHADVIGIPRRKQVEKFRLFGAVERAIALYDLMDEARPLTCAALHRLLQHALLFRPLIAHLPFLGVVSSRDVAEPLQRLFGIGTVRWYGVRGEADYPGSVVMPHYPSGFAALSERLSVPYAGAVFLVGAGAFGKIYCHWIKDKGGIAIDIGSIFDSWALVGRIGHSVRGLDVYRDLPKISSGAAVTRYNDLLDHFALDSPRATPDTLPALPEYW